MDNIEKIKELVKNNNGILLVKDAQENNIHRQYIKQACQDNCVNSKNFELHS